MVAWTCNNGVRHEYDTKKEEWTKTERNCIKTDVKDEGG